MLAIALARTPGWVSSYGPRGASVPLPTRMRFLAPDALVAISPIANRLIFTDVYRSAEAQLYARRTRRGTQRPGYSAHNFGLAVDLDVGRCMKALKLDKRQLDALMMERAFWCYRADDRLASENWHFTFGASGPGSTAVERAIVLRYGQFLALKPVDVQTGLAKLGLYRGALDGMLGPLSKEAIMAFQRAWLLQADGKAGPMTQRTLAVVTAEVEVVEATPVQS